jgi:uncharacterized protein
MLPHARAPLTPVAPANRVESIDIVRGLALLGVLQVNLLTEFRVSLFTQFETRHTHSGWLNHFTDDVLSVAVFSKALALFSFLFGVGLGAQYERAAGAGRPFLPFAMRRLAILLGIGTVHMLLIWNGDILMSYAIAGLAVVSLVRCSTRVLLGLSAIALTVHLLPIPYPDMFGPDESMSEHIRNAVRVYGSGDFMDVARFRIHEIRHIAPLLLGTFPRTIGLYFLGVVAWRERLFEAPEQRLNVLRTIAVLGIFGGGAMALAMFAVSEGWLAIGNTLGGVVVMVSEIALALGYAAAIILLARRPSAGRALRPFASLGRAALTNYVAQSILFGLLFYGYGAGLFGHLGPAAAAGLGLVVYALQVIASQAWFKRFRFGPLEWLWRSLSYGARQPAAAASRA